MGIRENVLIGGSSFTLELRFTGAEDYRETFDTWEEAHAMELKIKQRLRDTAKLARAAKRSQSKAPAQPSDPFAAFMEESVYDLVVSYVAHKKVKSPIKRNGKQGAGWDGHVPIIKRFASSARVKDIDPTWAEDIVARMRSTLSKNQKPYAYATIMKQLSLINSAVDEAAWRLNINPPKLPFDTRRLFPKNWDKPRDRIYRPGEEAALRQAIDNFASPTRPHWQALLTLVLETGARLQELVLANWDEFDLDERVWWIPEVNNKTDTAREVPLSAKATATLVKLAQEKDPSSTRVLHLLGNPNRVSNQFCDSIKPKAGLTDMTFHDHRHVAATRMGDKKKSKLSSADVAKILGHSEKTLRRVYDHTPARDLVDLMP